MVRVFVVVLDPFLVDVFLVGGHGSVAVFRRSVPNRVYGGGPPPARVRHYIGPPRFGVAIDARVDRQRLNDQSAKSRMTNAISVS